MMPIGRAWPLPVYRKPMAAWMPAAHLHFWWQLVSDGCRTCSGGLYCREPAGQRAAELGEYALKASGYKKVPACQGRKGQSLLLGIEFQSGKEAFWTG